MITIIGNHSVQLIIGTVIAVRQGANLGTLNTPCQLQP